MNFIKTQIAGKIQQVYNYLFSLSGDFLLQYKPVFFEENNPASKLSSLNALFEVGFLCLGRIIDKF